MINNCISDFSKASLFLLNIVEQTKTKLKTIFNWQADVLITVTVINRDLTVDLTQKHKHNFAVIFKAKK